MRNCIIICITLLLFSIGFSQDYSEDELSMKLKRSLKMKGTGQGLVGGGAILAGLGLVMYLEGADEMGVYSTKNNSNVGTDGAGKFFGGFVLLMGGVAAINTGVAFWIVGGAKANRYKRQMKSYEKKVSLGVNRNGIGLQFKF